MVPKKPLYKPPTPCPLRIPFNASKGPLNLPELLPPYNPPTSWTCKLHLIISIGVNKKLTINPLAQPAKHNCGMERGWDEKRRIWDWKNPYPANKTEFSRMEPRRGVDRPLINYNNVQDRGLPCTNR